MFSTARNVTVLWLKQQNAVNGVGYRTNLRNSYFTINATMNAEIRISVNALLCEVLQKIVCSYHSMICIMGVRTHLSWSADLLLTPYKSTGKLFS